MSIFSAKQRNAALLQVPVGYHARHVVYVGKPAHTLRDGVGQVETGLHPGTEYQWDWQHSFNSMGKHGKRWKYRVCYDHFFFPCDRPRGDLV